MTDGGSPYVCPGGGFPPLPGTQYDIDGTCFNTPGTDDYHASGLDPCGNAWTLDCTIPRSLTSGNIDVFLAGGPFHYTGAGIGYTTLPYVGYNPGLFRGIISAGQFAPTTVEAWP